LGRHPLRGSRQLSPDKVKTRDQTEYRPFPSGWQGSLRSCLAAEGRGGACHWQVMPMADEPQALIRVDAGGPYLEYAGGTFRPVHRSLLQVGKPVSVYHRTGTDVVVVRGQAGGSFEAWRRQAETSWVGRRRA
jgi:hypothetical protein